MNLEQAKQVLEAAINAGLLKGVYTLQDTSTILQALQVLHTIEESKVEQIKPAK